MKPSRPPPLFAASAAFAAFTRRHPRAIAATVAIALGGFGVTAFGIVPMMDEVDRMPRSLVTEAIVGHDIEAQLETLAQHDLELHRSDLTRASDTADSLLKRLGVVDPAAAQFLRTDATARRLLEGRPGKMVNVGTDESGALESLVARYAAAESRLEGTHFTRLTVSRADAGGFRAEVETAPLSAQVRLASGTVAVSLFAATDAARVPDSVAVQLADVFSSEIDFHRELRRGDRFSVVYEALTADGEPITWGSASGRVLAAEFVNGGRRHDAVWFARSDGRGAYFGLDGRSKTGAYLASPLVFSRMTSGFATRMHPLLNQWRAHRGVDYSAPSGTAVRAVGDGRVSFAGWQSGYGNVVEIEHRDGRATLYAHLSRIDVKLGTPIRQGEPLGAVGATGWATGPHLHFELKVGGEQRNPAELARISETVALSEADRQRLGNRVMLARGQLDAALSVGATMHLAE